MADTPRVGVRSNHNAEDFARRHDATYVEGKDPKFHYFYQNGQRETDMQTSISQGYEVVTSGNDPKIASARGFKDGSSKQTRLGELVLLRVPKEIYEARQAEEHQVWKDRVNRISELKNRQEGAGESRIRAEGGVELRRD